MTIYPHDALKSSAHSGAQTSLSQTPMDTKDSSNQPTSTDTGRTDAHSGIPTPFAKIK